VFKCRDYGEEVGREWLLDEGVMKGFGVIKECSAGGWALNKLH